jgi:hypothetical protein
MDIALLAALIAFAGVILAAIVTSGRRRTSSSEPRSTSFTSNRQSAYRILSELIPQAGIPLPPRTDLELASSRLQHLVTANELYLDDSDIGLAAYHFQCLLRASDLADVQGIIQRQGKKLDVRYVHRWLGEFSRGLDDPVILERFREIWAKR